MAVSADREDELFSFDGKATDPHGERASPSVDPAQPQTKENERPASDAMRLAITCLGGRKSWNGSVRGFFGLLKRDVVIESEGAVERGVLIFRESLTFDNGDQENREWSLWDTADGVAMEADDIEQLRPGRVEDGLFVIDYHLRLNGLTFQYSDAFHAGPNGAVSNTGRAKLLGLPVMTVTVSAKPS